MNRVRIITSAFDPCTTHIDVGDVGSQRWKKHEFMNRILLVSLWNWTTWWNSLSPLIMLGLKNWDSLENLQYSFYYFWWKRRRVDLMGFHCLWSLKPIWVCPFLNLFFENFSGHVIGSRNNYTRWRNKVHRNMLVADHRPGDRFVGALDGAAKQFSDDLTKDFLLRICYDDAKTKEIYYGYWSCR